MLKDRCNKNRNYMSMYFLKLYGLFRGLGNDEYQITLNGSLVTQHSREE